MQDFQGNSGIIQTGNNTGATPSIRNIKKPYLINKLNHTNFQDGTIQIVFEHSKYKHTISLNAKPLPCLGESLECVWPESDAEAYKQLASYKFKEIQITNGKNVLVVKPQDVFISGKSTNFLLPETCHELISRQTRRYACTDINAQIIQNGVIFEGKLMDFNMSFFRVEILEHNTQAFFWINHSASINLILTAENGVIFASECRIAQNRNGYKTRKNFVIEPLNQKISRFLKKDYRTTRYELVPSPYVIFTHPLSLKKMSLGILDISGSGFSVKEDVESAVLIPGMILPEIEIHLANSFNVKCKAQVVHRMAQDQQDRGGYVKTGLALLDMGVEDHGKILSLLHHAKNPNLYLGGKVNEDDLWRFFFETGFIYPGKYKFIQENKEDLKALYKKIYSDSPRIAKHFIYRDKGEILGHMAIIRFYQKSWLIQHHAADHGSSQFAGIDVLDQIGRFTNESSNIFSMNMEYVFCYFRPDNKFPNQVFGGAARKINDNKKCSLDAFSYFHYQNKSEKPSVEMKEPWQLSMVQSQDLLEFQIFYEGTSGGLLADALDMAPDSMDLGDLKPEYTAMGFKRERYQFALKKENRLKAVFSLNIADIGLNFSNITNSIHVYIVDPEGLEMETLEVALLKLSSYYSVKEIPILLYPESFTDSHPIQKEKTYVLWVLATKALDSYFGYMKRLFRRMNTMQSANDSKPGTSL
ncbi:MAG: PilZ domain-containing protein [Proteobacteria bacterium]|nr:PilZ domain-containing protein [Pseudomonadota bacterium]MBU4469355.1 PilZ domain-containing protein [Pseudomonadota bacterium]MCG2753570.1 hypothetical protein [Desulfobacteraceae bacterium]